MADSDIIVEATGSVGGFEQIQVYWTVDDPNDQGLPYLKLDLVEVWASLTNDRTTAALVGEGLHNFSHIGLTDGDTWYYWLRARNKAGYYGEWSPSDPVKGISNLVAAGGTFVGTFKTASSGRRAEITQGKNAILGYNSLGSLVTRIGQDPDGSLLDYLRITVPLGALSTSYAATITCNSGRGIELTTTGADGAYIGVATGEGVALTAQVVSGTGASSFAVDGFSRSSGAAIRGWNAGAGYAFYAAVGGYGPFTGAHDALIAKSDPAGPGDLVVDVRMLASSGISNAVFEVRRSDKANQKGVLGVIASRVSLDLSDPRQWGADLDETPFVHTHDWVQVNALGEGLMNVTGDVEAGDLLVASDVHGKAMKQSDDIVRSYTVARSRAASSGGLVPCIYLSG